MMDEFARYKLSKGIGLVPTINGKRLEDQTLYMVEP